MNKNSNPLTERKRIVSWWLRWNDLNWPSVDNLDKIKRRAEKIAEANATTAMIFGTHFRWDFLPYFTLLHDYIATVSEELGKYGVELWDHHSVNLIHRYDTRDEMRHVMLHSGPHLPFSPSREAAATWEYGGKRLNDWRMIDVKNNDVLYYPQYAAEGFCIRNPQFREAYTDYAKRLIQETGITGLSADDPVHYMHFNSCACPYCRAELKARTGIELPPIDDRSFWGNWSNPAWNEWIDMRFDAAKVFFKELSSALPKDFRLTTCGINSAAPTANSMGSDARAFLSGANYVNLEMSGNTPPYKHDPVTVNKEIADRLTGSSHHQAVARERGVNCFSTGFGFTEETANIVWAVNKMLGSDCWFSTLKDRLGLPTHILDSLPDEWDVVGKPFGFEKDHPHLFDGKQIAQLGVYFSYETRMHTLFGGTSKGYYEDWTKTLKLLFNKGLSPHTVFNFPDDTNTYPVILVPSALTMTADEQLALDNYINRGGTVIAYGPCAIKGCESKRDMPTSPIVNSPDEFLCSVPNGVWVKLPDWQTKTEFPTLEADFEWKEIRQGLFYNPLRIGEQNLPKTLIPLVKKYIRPMPIEIIDAQGYLITFFENDESYTVQMLAADYETDIDHKLDEMRFHRSRVNYINYVEPVGVTERIVLKTDLTPDVYTPFNDEKAELKISNGICTVGLPQKTSFIILNFPKKA